MASQTAGGLARNIRITSSALVPPQPDDQCTKDTLAGKQGNTMAPVEINPAHVHEFPGREDFYRWLAENHATAPEVWIRIHKRASGLASINPEEAIEVVLCWGWIDGIRKGLDEKSFFQRYSPRGRKSVWSKKNVETVGRQIGRAHV